MMDIQDIDKMPAGREMDGQVHALIFNKAVPTDHDWMHDTFCDCVPRYSTDIAAAWEVIDKLDELYSAWFEIRGPRVWLAQCHLPGYKQFSATGLANASLAINRAALKAMKGNERRQR